MTEKHLPPLDLTGPASQVTDRWRKWKHAFEYYAKGKGIDNVHKKTSQLWHFSGMEVQDIKEYLQDLVLSQRREITLTRCSVFRIGYLSGIPPD